MNSEQAKELLNRYEQGQCTPEEMGLLEGWFDSLVANAQWDEEEERQYVFGAKMKQVIDSRIAEVPVKRIWPLYLRIAAAASVLFFLSFGGYFVLHNRAIQQSAQHEPVILPGGNKAILTLANGQQIILTDAKNGKIARQGNTLVDKTADGSVRYTANGNSELAYNTVTTPRGGQYHLTLADGTNVWLNAGSSIKYPTVFRGKDRKVEVTGEAYFEVAHNKAMPFKVSTATQTVEVLGTHFNINAYTDETDVKTTLLEGSVKVSSGNNFTLIKPGEQAVLAADGFNVQNVDTEEAVSWKDGMFRFTDESLERIMRKIARWYDVDIEYADNGVKSLPFNGIITRFSDANKVLRMLELTDQVHFKIEGKKIIVTK